MARYFGFALADSMFKGDCDIKRKALSVEEAKEKVKMGVSPCLNPSHQATITAMNQRFDLEVVIPEKPINVSLNAGDSIVVMGVRGLARLTDRHEYTDEEIASASFQFSEYSVV